MPLNNVGMSSHNAQWVPFNGNPWFRWRKNDMGDISGMCMRKHRKFKTSVAIQSRSPLTPVTAFGSFIRRLWLTLSRLTTATVKGMFVAHLISAKLDALNTTVEIDCLHNCSTTISNRISSHFVFVCARICFWFCFPPAFQSQPTIRNKCALMLAHSTSDFSLE